MQIPGGGRRKEREQRAESEKLASRFERDTRSKEGEMRANARCKGTTSGREKEAEEKGRS